MKLSFPHNLRLKKRRQYQDLQHQSKRFRCDNYFVVLVRENTFSHPRLGITVSKRHVARAVDRNRLKRIIRESFRTNQCQLGHFDIVIILYHRVTELTSQQLGQRLLQFWQQLMQWSGER